MPLASARASSVPRESQTSRAPRRRSARRMVPGPAAERDGTVAGPAATALRRGPERRPLRPALLALPCPALPGGTRCSAARPTPFVPRRRGRAPLLLPPSLCRRPPAPRAGRQSGAPRLPPPTASTPIIPPRPPSNPRGAEARPAQPPASSEESAAGPGGAGRDLHPHPGFGPKAATSATAPSLGTGRLSPRGSRCDWVWNCGVPAWLLGHPQPTGLLCFTRGTGEEKGWRDLNSVPWVCAA